MTDKEVRHWIGSTNYNGPITYDEVYKQDISRVIALAIKLKDKIILERDSKWSEAIGKSHLVNPVQFAKILDEVQGSE